LEEGKKKTLRFLPLSRGRRASRPIKEKEKGNALFDEKKKERECASRTSRKGTTKAAARGGGRKKEETFSQEVTQEGK